MQYVMVRNSINLQMIVGALWIRSCLVLVSTTLLVGSGCTTIGPNRMPADIFWPALPQPPRIEYIESFSGSDYFAPKKSKRFISFLFGREAPTRFARPIDVAVDKKGNIYVADSPSYVLVLDKEMEVVRKIGHVGQAKIIGTAGIDFDDNRNELYAVDVIQKIVMVIDPDSNILKRQFGPEGLNRPVDITVSPDGSKVAVVDRGDHDVKIFDAIEGTLIKKIGRDGKEDGNFFFPLHAKYDYYGKLFVTDAFNFRIQVFDQDGSFLYKFGEPGQTPGYFARPKGIDIDSDGHIYVVDAAFGNVQIFEQDSGKFHMAFGHNGRLPGEFRLPNGLAIGNDDRIYVIDSINRRVQIFRYIKADEADSIAESARQNSR